MVHAPHRGINSRTKALLPCYNSDSSWLKMTNLFCTVNVLLILPYRGRSQKCRNIWKRSQLWRELNKIYQLSPMLLARRTDWHSANICAQRALFSPYPITQHIPLEKSRGWQQNTELARNTECPLGIVVRIMET